MAIYIKRESENEIIARLAQDDWELPSQIKILEQWLMENEELIVPSSYIADIGFTMRKNACGGGAILSVQAMSIMATLGFQLYFSEYPD